MKTEYDDARRMLVELLHRDDDRPVAGIGALSAKDQDFLITTCAATVMLITLARIASFEEASALKGLAALELEDHIKKLVIA
jgi:hypothetical protein